MFEVFELVTGVAEAISTLGDLASWARSHWRVVLCLAPFSGMLLSAPIPLFHIHFPPGVLILSGLGGGIGGLLWQRQQG